MPELPEVEFIRRELSSTLVGQKLLTTWGIYDLSQAAGKEVEAVQRKGKYLLLRLRDGWVVCHLGMTGQIHLDKPEPEKHLKCVLQFQLNKVGFTDPRGFGSVSWLGGDDLSKAPGLLGRLGTDPLEKDFDKTGAGQLLSGRDTPVKAALLEQGAIPGVGNYIADEALWLAKVNPLSRHLSPAVGREIVSAVLEVMDKSLALGGVSMADYQHADGSKGSGAQALKVYGRSGKECLRCGQVLEKRRVSGRGTTWCGRCQTLQ